MVDSDESQLEFEESDALFRDPFDLYGRCGGPNAYYACLNLQAELVNDPLIREFCQNVIRKNGHLFENKIVLEVDCGLGILTMVASQYARKVVAVETSRLADLLAENLTRNKIENVIVLKGDIDEMESLPEEIDILISQYMGFLMYDKRLLARFLKARDKFLKPQGIVMPNYIHLLLSGANYSQGMRRGQGNCIPVRIPGEVIEETVPSSEIITDEHVVRKLNLRTVRIDNYNFSNKFYLVVYRCGRVNALVLHLEIGFTTCHKRVLLSTSPFERPTRWKQLVLLSKEPLKCVPGNIVRGELVIRGPKCDEESAMHFAVDRLGLLSLKEQQKINLDSLKGVEKRRPFGQKTSSNDVLSENPMTLTRTFFRRNFA